MAKKEKFKGTDISVSVDYSEAVRIKRKKLWNYGEGHRKEGDKVSLRYDSLIFNNKKFVYDELFGIGFHQADSEAAVPN